MTKEEILEKSRNENQNKDYADLEAQSKGALVAYYAGFVFCSICAVLELIFKRTVNAGVWMILFGMLSTAFLVKYIRLQKKHELFVFLAYLFGFCFNVVLFLLQLMGKIN